MTDLLIDAILAVWARVRGAVGDRFEGGVERLREIGEPPPGVVLTSPDGSVYTGVAIVDRNRLILLIAFREGGDGRARSPPSAPSTSSSTTSPQYARPDLTPPSGYARGPLTLYDEGQRHPFAEDEPLWRR